MFIFRKKIGGEKMISEEQRAHEFALEVAKMRFELDYRNSTLKGVPMQDIDTQELLRVYTAAYNLMFEERKE